MGRVTVRPGAAVMDLSALQQPLSTGQALRSALGVLLCAVL